MEVWREWRWVEIRDEVVVYRADSSEGWERLERLVALERAAAAAGVPTPEFVVVDLAARRVERARVSGLMGRDLERAIFGGPAPADRYSPDVAISALGWLFAESLGRAMAAVHTVPLPHGLPPPSLDVERITAILAAAGRDDLVAGCVDARWEGLEGPEVVCHADLHFENLVADPGTGEIRAVFDFADGCRAPRALDHQFTLSQGPPFARRVLDAYTEASGVTVRWEDVVAYHLRAAYEHVDHQAGTERFPSILAWVTQALAFARSQ